MKRLTFSAAYPLNENPGTFLLLSLNVVVCTCGPVGMWVCYFHWYLLLVITEISLQGYELGGEAILLRYPNNTGSPGSQAAHPSTNPVNPVKKKPQDGLVVLEM